MSKHTGIRVCVRVSPRVSSWILKPVNRMGATLREEEQKSTTRDVLKHRLQDLYTFTPAVLNCARPLVYISIVLKQTMHLLRM